MGPFSNHTYASFPNPILFRLVNYWLVLIYDFTVSERLKMKLIWSVCFHRVCSKILAFRRLTNRLTPLFLVWRHVINHSKFPVIEGREIFSSKNDHKIFTNALFVWCLKSGFSNGFSPLYLQNVLAEKTAIQGAIWIVF